MENINFWVVLAQIINFWIIFFIFKYFLWDKIVSIIEKRREQLKALDNSDAEVAKKMMEAEEESKKLIDEARQKAHSIETTSEDLAKKEYARKLAEAETKAQAIEDSATRDIEKQKIDMVNSLKDRVLEISLQLNSKLFDDSSKNKEFMQKELNSIKM